MRTLRRYSASFVGVGTSKALRLGVVDGAAPALHHQVREREVVTEARIDLDVVRATYRIDRPVAARDRPEPRLLLAQPDLVAPVGALAVAAVGRASARGAPPRTRRPGQRSCGRACGARPTPTSRSRPKRRRSPPASRAPRGPAPRPCRRGGSGSASRRSNPSTISSRPVARRVGGDDELEPLARIVEREQVLEPPRDHRLLVVGGDDHGHGRRRRRREHPAQAAPARAAAAKSG